LIGVPSLPLGGGTGLQPRLLKTFAMVQVVRSVIFMVFVREKVEIEKSLQSRLRWKTHPWCTRLTKRRFELRKVVEDRVVARDDERKHNDEGDRQCGLWRRQKFQVAKRVDAFTISLRLIKLLKRTWSVELRLIDLRRRSGNKEEKILRSFKEDRHFCTSINNIMAPESSALYVVEVDGRGKVSNSVPNCYKEQMCDANYFQKEIVENPKMKCFKSQVAALCGMDLKVYVIKAKKGMAQYYREGGEPACVRVLTANPGFLSSNNALASLLTIDPDNGLPEWTVCGKAYVVWDDGTSPLSWGQVWGIHEMIHCSMDIYDMRRANDTIRGWAEEYRNKTFEPPSGCGAMDIYTVVARLNDFKYYSTRI